MDAAAVEGLRLPAHAWLDGTPLNAIELLLGGKPDGTTVSQRLLPRAREFVGTVVPRSLSFIIGVVARMVEELELPAQQPGLSLQILQSLSACMRRGFDTFTKLEFANADRALIGRVEVHQAFAEVWKSILGEPDDL